MKLLSSCKIAFSLYSRIPMTKTDWSVDSMKYALCFFPLIGVVIGGGEFLWIYFSRLVGIGDMLICGIAVFIPIALTGGIHADGYCDTADALASNKSKEDKLKILKDTHTGAFAVIWWGVYIILLFSAFSEVILLPIKEIAALCMVFILSRCMSGFISVKFKPAKNEGMLFSITDSTLKNKVIVILTILFLILSLIVFFLSNICGICCIFSAFMLLLCYRHFSYRQFGGITGDLAGYFLQISELVMLIIPVLAIRVVRWI